MKTILLKDAVALIPDGANVSTATAPRDVYAYAFGTQGLMGGVSLQALKITKRST